MSRLIMLSFCTGQIGSDGQEDQSGEGRQNPVVQRVLYTLLIIIGRKGCGSWQISFLGAANL